MAEYLHQHPEFRDLLRILAEEMSIDAGLVEKGYWIMHTLYGLKAQGYDFELKGGTSLSKSYKMLESCKPLIRRAFINNLNILSANTFCS